MPKAVPITVVETPEYLGAMRDLMGDEERSLLVAYLAYNVLAGDLVPGTGGLRKLRWALQGRGKRGGARIIYYFHDPTMPLFLLTAYAKNRRDDLSEADRNAYKKLVADLVRRYRSRGANP